MNDCFKENVEEAIRTHRNILSEESQFAVSLKLEEGLPNKISIQHLTAIGVPVSLNNVSKLVRDASKSSPKAGNSSYVKYGQMWQISNCEALQAQSSKLSDFLPELTNKMLLLMGLNPLVVKVKTILRDFFICGTDGFAKFNFKEDNAGFMKMILQIPVEGGHEEGRIKVELNEQIQLFNVCEDSDRHYHVTAFYSDCDHQLEKVTFGWRLAMVFDLVLEEQIFHNTLSPPANLHSFLAIGHIQDILTQWTTNENDYPRMLALVLDHRYSPTQLNFHSLKGRDRLLAGLLRSVDSVDTYLSHFQAHGLTITLSDQEDSENTDSDCPDSSCICYVSKVCSCHKRVRRRAHLQPNLRNGVKILSLTGVDGKTMECVPIDVDLGSETILFNRNVYNTRPTVTVFDCENMVYDVTDGHKELGLLRWLREPRAVLIIFPKNSLKMFLLGNFTAALDRLEMHPDVRTLNAVITFCQGFPERVWIGANDREERTRRLLSLCVRLRAKTEGLKLLEILASNFPGREQADYEGIRNKAIAIETANLIMVIGWNSASIISIEKLLSLKRIKDQMENFAHFALAFFDLGLPEIGKNIGNRLVAMLQIKTCSMLPNLTISAIVACTSMILRMHQFDGAGLYRIYSLCIGLKSLPLQKLFAVIEGIQKTCSVYLENNQVYQRLQRDLHRHLLSCYIPEELVVDVMLFYLKLDDAVLLKEFTHTIATQRTAIELIVSSPEIWNKAVTTLGGKWALSFLVNIRIGHLEKMTIPIFTWNQKSTAFIANAFLDDFFASSSVRHTVSGFNSRSQAEKWIELLFGPDQVKSGHSADVEIKYQDSKIVCVITKNRDLHWHHLNMFHKSRAELLALRDRRRRRLGEDVSSLKVEIFTTSSSSSSSSPISPRSSPPAAKWPRIIDEE
ncbi:uncharacterized protein LOC130692785 [Daphnia carinata]|uniref:uncharacterized protein LOC130692785 n=1 Tax=Daphnia carinata TaxID=120202 RepID=UPI00257982BA|nr:uncharacterized protein LOC130692785 [Daphnia carinata]